jgi:hypothetical protein
VVALLAFWTISVRVFVAVVLVQFNVVGASDMLLAFLKVTTTTNVFADDETVRLLASRSAMLLSLKVEAVVNSVSTRAIWERAGAANRSKATPQSSGNLTRTERGMDVFMSIGRRLKWIDSRQMFNRQKHQGSPLGTESACQ